MRRRELKYRGARQESAQNMKSPNSEKIRKIVKEFFNKMGFEVEAEINPPRDFTIPINLKSNEPQILIGKNGEVLLEVQRLLKAVLRKKIAPDKTFYLDLDINNYKKKRNEYLRELARSAADDVSLSRKEKELFPMSAYDRRIVHLELSLRPDVWTESVGEAPERRIIIKSR